MLGGACVCVHARVCAQAPFIDFTRKAFGRRVGACVEARASEVVLSIVVFEFGRDCGVC